MATLTGKSIATTYDQLWFRGTTEPSGTTGAVNVLTTENDGTDDLATPLYLGTERIGIGTATPSNLLEVAQSSADENMTLSCYSTTDAHMAALNLRKSSNATIGTAAATAAGETLGQIVAQGYDTDNDLKGSSIIRFQGDAAPDGDSVPGRILFMTSDLDDSGSPTERMRIDDAGFVGIGASAPASQLDVSSDSGGGKPIVTIANHAADTEAGMLQFRKTRGTTIGTAGTVPSADDDLGSIRFYGSDGDTWEQGAWIIGEAAETWGTTDYGARIRFGTCLNTDVTVRERMVIDHQGNVGIGVAAPSALLHIKKTGMTDETSVAMTADGTGNSARRYAEFGVHYNSGATVDAPCAFIRMDATDDVTHYIWANNDDDLFASSTIANIGTTTGTKIGDMTSDERLKNISEDLFPYGLAEVNNLVPIKYSMKADATNKQKLGFGGQTTQSIIPEVVHDTGECIDGYTWGVDEKGNQINQVANSDDKDTKLSMSYNGIIPVLVKAIQELSAEVEKLKNK